MNAEQKARLYKTEDAGLYLICWSDQRGKWELRRKLANSERTLFIKACEYKTALLVVANNLQNGTPNRRYLVVRKTN